MIEKISFEYLDGQDHEIMKIERKLNEIIDAVNKLEEALSGKNKYSGYVIALSDSVILDLQTKPQI